MSSGSLVKVEDLRAGRRVELHPATDDWMRGDRFGTIVRVVNDTASVKLDKSGRTKAVPYDLIFSVFD